MDDNTGTDLRTWLVDQCCNVLKVLDNGLEVTLKDNTKGIVTYYNNCTGSFTLNNEVVTHQADEVIAIVRPSKVLWGKS